MADFYCAFLPADLPHVSHSWSCNEIMAETDDNTFAKGEL